MNSWRNRTAIVAVLLGGLAAGCAGPSSEPPTSSAVASAGQQEPTIGTEPTMHPSAGSLPPFIAIRRLAATPEGESLRLSLTLAASVPPGTPPVGMLAYRFLVDTDGDGVPDYTASLEVRPGGGFVPILVDHGSGERLEGPRFPGTANLAGAEVQLTLPLAAMGCPARIGVRGLTEQILASTTLGDVAPGADDWTRVDAGCP